MVSEYQQIESHPPRRMTYPYGGLFFLKNKDPNNYILHREFFFYSILALYLFMLWYLANIFKNYDFLIRTNEGGVVWYFSVFSFAALMMVLAVSIFYASQNVYPLLGLGYSLLLVGMAVLLFNYQKNEIDRGFEHDPVQNAYIFLILYAFVSFFIV